ncbi:hypothetical protein ACW95P_04255 [Candidatus Mycoplasma pogonae]
MKKTNNNFKLQNLRKTSLFVLSTIPLIASSIAISGVGNGPNDWYDGESIMGWIENPVNNIKNLTPGQKEAFANGNAHAFGKNDIRQVESDMAELYQRYIAMKKLRDNTSGKYYSHYSQSEEFVRPIFDKALKDAENALSNPEYNVIDFVQIKKLGEELYQKWNALDGFENILLKEVASKKVLTHAMKAYFNNWIIVNLRNMRENEMGERNNINDDYLAKVNEWKSLIVEATKKFEGYIDFINEYKIKKNESKYQNATPRLKEDFDNAIENAVKANIMTPDIESEKQKIINAWNNLDGLVNSNENLRTLESKIQDVNKLPHLTNGYKQKIIDLLNSSGKRPVNLSKTNAKYSEDLEKIVANAREKDNQFNSVVEVFKNYQNTIGTIKYDEASNKLTEDTKVFQALASILEDPTQPDGSIAKTVDNLLNKSYDLQYFKLKFTGNLRDVENAIQKINQAKTALNGVEEFQRKKQALIDKLNKEPLNTLNLLTKNDIKSKINGVKNSSELSDIEAKANGLVNEVKYLKSVIADMEDYKKNGEYLLATNKNEYDLALQNLKNKLNTNLFADSIDDLTKFTANEAQAKTKLNGLEVRKNQLKEKLKTSPLSALNQKTKEAIEAKINGAHRVSELDSLDTKATAIANAFKTLKDEIANLEAYKTNVDYRLADNDKRTNFDNNLDALKIEASKTANILEAPVSTFNNLVAAAITTKNELNGNEIKNSLDADVNGFNNITEENRTIIKNKIAAIGTQASAIKIKDDFKVINEKIGAEKVKISGYNFSNNLKNQYFDEFKNFSANDEAVTDIIDKITQAGNRAKAIQDAWLEYVKTFDHFKNLVGTINFDSASNRDSNAQNVYNALKEVISSFIWEPWPFRSNYDINHLTMKDDMTVEKINAAKRKIQLQESTLNGIEVQTNLKNNVKNKLNSAPFNVLNEITKNAIISAIDAINTPNGGTLSNKLREIEAKMNKATELSKKITQFEAAKLTANYRLSDDEKRQQFDNLLASLKAKENQNTYDDDAIYRLAINANTDMLNGDANLRAAQATIDGYVNYGTSQKTDTKNILASNDSRVDTKAKFDALVSLFSKANGILGQAIGEINNLSHLNSTHKTNVINRIKNYSLGQKDESQLRTMIMSGSDLVNAKNFDQKFNQLAAKLKEYTDKIGTVQHDSATTKVDSDTKVKEALQSVLQSPRIETISSTTTITDGVFSVISSEPINNSITKIQNAIIALNGDVVAKKAELKAKLDAKPFSNMASLIIDNLKNEINTKISLDQFAPIETKINNANPIVKEINDKITKLTDMLASPNYKLASDDKQSSFNTIKNNIERLLNQDLFENAKLNQAKETLKTFDNIDLDGDANLATAERSVNGLDALSNDQKNQAIQKIKDLTKVDTKKKLDDAIANVTTINTALKTAKTKVQNLKHISQTAKDAAKKQLEQINISDLVLTTTQASVDAIINPLTALNNKFDDLKTKLGKYTATIGQTKHDLADDKNKLDQKVLAALATVLNNPPTTLAKDTNIENLTFSAANATAVTTAIEEIENAFKKLNGDEVLRAKITEFLKDTKLDALNAATKAAVTVAANSATTEAELDKVKAKVETTLENKSKIEKAISDLIAEKEKANYKLAEQSKKAAFDTQLTELQTKLANDNIYDKTADEIAKISEAAEAAKTALDGDKNLEAALKKLSDLTNIATTQKARIVAKAKNLDQIDNKIKLDDLVTIFTAVNNDIATKQVEVGGLLHLSSEVQKHFKDQLSNIDPSLNKTQIDTKLAKDLASAKDLNAKFTDLKAKLKEYTDVIGTPKHNLATNKVAEDNKVIAELAKVLETPNILTLTATTNINSKTLRVTDGTKVDEAITVIDNSLKVLDGENVLKKQKTDYANEIKNKIKVLPHFSNDLGAEFGNRISALVTANVNNATQSLADFKPLIDALKTEADSLNTDYDKLANALQDYLNTFEQTKYTKATNQDEQNNAVFAALNEVLEPSVTKPSDLTKDYVIAVPKMKLGTTATTIDKAVAKITAAKVALNGDEVALDEFKRELNAKLDNVPFKDVIDTTFIDTIKKDIESQTNLDGLDPIKVKIDAATDLIAKINQKGAELNTIKATDNYQLADNDKKQAFDNFSTEIDELFKKDIFDAAEVAKANEKLATAIPELNGDTNLSTSKAKINALNNLSTSQKAQSKTKLMDRSQVTNKTTLDATDATLSAINDALGTAKNTITNLTHVNETNKAATVTSLEAIDITNLSTEEAQKAIAAIVDKATALNDKFAKLKEALAQYTNTIGETKHDLADDKDKLNQDVLSALKSVLDGVTSTDLTKAFDISYNKLKVANAADVETAITAITEAFDKLNGDKVLEDRINAFVATLDTDENLQKLNEATKQAIRKAAEAAKTAVALNEVKDKANKALENKATLEKAIADLQPVKNTADYKLASTDKASDFDTKLTELEAKLANENIYDKTSDEIDDLSKPAQDAKKALNGNNNKIEAKNEIDKLTNINSSKRIDIKTQMDDLSKINTKDKLDELVSDYQEINSDIGTKKTTISGLTHLAPNVQNHFNGKLENIDPTQDKTTINANNSAIVTQATKLNDKFNELVAKLKDYTDIIGKAKHDLATNKATQDTAVMTAVNSILETSQLTTLTNTSTINDEKLSVNDIAKITEAINAIETAINSLDGETVLEREKTQLADNAKTAIGNLAHLSPELAKEFTDKIDALPRNDKTQDKDTFASEVAKIKTTAETLNNEYNKVDQALKDYLAVLDKVQYTEANNADAQDKALFDALNEILQTPVTKPEPFDNSYTIADFKMKAGTTSDKITKAIEAIAAAKSALNGETILENKKIALVDTAKKEIEKLSNLSKTLIDQFKNELTELDTKDETEDETAFAAKVNPITTKAHALNDEKAKLIALVNASPLTTLQEAFRNAIKTEIDNAVELTDLNPIQKRLEDATNGIEKINKKVAELETVKDSDNYKLADDVKQKEFDDLIQSLKNHLTNDLFDATKLTEANNAVAAANSNMLNGGANLVASKNKVDHLTNLSATQKAEAIKKLEDRTNVNSKATLDAVDETLKGINTKFGVAKTTVSEMNHLTETAKQAVEAELGAIDITSLSTDQAQSEIDKVLAKQNELKAELDKLKAALKKYTDTIGTNQHNLADNKDAIDQEVLAALKGVIDSFSDTSLTNSINLNNAKLATNNKDDLANATKVIEAALAKLNGETNLTEAEEKVKKLANLSDAQKTQALTKLNNESEINSKAALDTAVNEFETINTKLGEAKTAIQDLTHLVTTTQTNAVIKLGEIDVTDATASGVETTSKLIVDKVKAINDTFNQLKTALQNYTNQIGEVKHVLADNPSAADQEVTEQLNAVLENFDATTLTKGIDIDSYKLTASESSEVSDAIAKINQAFNKLNGDTNKTYALTEISKLSEIADSKRTLIENKINDLTQINSKTKLDELVTTFSDINTLLVTKKAEISNQKHLASEVEQHFKAELANIDVDADKTVIENAIEIKVKEAQNVNAKFNDLQTALQAYQAVLNKARYTQATNATEEDKVVIDALASVLKDFATSTTLDKSTDISTYKLSANTEVQVQTAIDSIEKALQALDGETVLQQQKTDFVTEIKKEIAALNHISVDLSHEFNEQIDKIAAPYLDNADQDLDAFKVLVNAVKTTAQKLNAEYSKVNAAFVDYQSAIGTNAYDHATNQEVQNAAVFAALNTLVDPKLTKPARLAKDYKVDSLKLAAGIDLTKINKAVEDIKAAKAALDGDQVVLKNKKDELKNLLKNPPLSDLPDTIKNNLKEEIDSKSDLDDLNQIKDRIDNAKDILEKVKAQITDLTAKKATSDYKLADEANKNNLDEALAKLNEDLTKDLFDSANVDKASENIKAAKNVTLNGNANLQAAKKEIDDLLNLSDDQKNQAKAKLDEIANSANNTVGNPTSKADLDVAVENFKTIDEEVKISKNKIANLNHLNDTVINKAKDDINKIDIKDLASDEVKTKSDEIVNKLIEVNNQFDQLQTKLKEYTDTIGTVKHDLTNDVNAIDQVIKSSLGNVLDNLPSGELVKNYDISGAKLKKANAEDIQKAITAIEDELNKLNGEQVLAAKIKELIDKLTSDAALSTLNQATKNAIIAEANKAQTLEKLKEIEDKANQAVLDQNKLQQVINDLKTAKESANYKLADPTKQADFDSKLTALENTLANDNLYDKTSDEVDVILDPTKNANTALDGDSNLEKALRDIEGMTNIPATPQRTAIKSQANNLSEINNKAALDDLITKFSAANTAIANANTEIAKLNYLSPELQDQFKTKAANINVDADQNTITATIKKHVDDAKELEAKFAELAEAAEKYKAAMETPKYLEADPANQTLQNQKVQEALESVLKDKTYTNFINEFKLINNETLKAGTTLDNVENAIAKIKDAVNSLDGTKQVDDVKEALKDKINNPDGIYNKLNDTTKEAILDEIDNANTDTKAEVNDIDQKAKEALDTHNELTNKVKELEDFKDNPNYKLASDAEKTAYDNAITKLKEELNKNLLDPDNKTTSNTAMSAADAAKTALDGNTNLAKAKEEIDKLTNLPDEVKNDIKNNLDTIAASGNGSNSKLTDEVNKAKEIAQKLDDTIQAIDVQPNLSDAAKTALKDQAKAIDANNSTAEIAKKLDEVTQKAKDLNDKFNDLKETYNKYKDAMDSAKYKDATDENKAEQDEAVTAATNNVLDSPTIPSATTELQGKVKAGTTTTDLDQAIKDIEKALNNLDGDTELQKAKNKLVDKTNPGNTLDPLNEATKNAIKEEVNNATSKKDVKDISDKADEALNTLKTIEEEIKKLNDAKVSDDYKLASDDKKQQFDEALKELTDLKNSNLIDTSIKDKLDKAQVNSDKVINELDGKANLDNAQKTIDGFTNLSLADREKAKIDIPTTSLDDLNKYVDDIKAINDEIKKQNDFIDKLPNLSDDAKTQAKDKIAEVVDLDKSKEENIENIQKVVDNILDINNYFNDLREVIDNYLSVRQTPTYTAATNGVEQDQKFVNALNEVIAKPITNPDDNIVNRFKAGVNEDKINEAIAKIKQATADLDGNIEVNKFKDKLINMIDDDAKYKHLSQATKESLKAKIYAVNPNESNWKEQLNIILLEVEDIITRVSQVLAKIVKLETLGATKYKAEITELKKILEQDWTRPINLPKDELVDNQNSESQSTNKLWWLLSLLGLIPVSLAALWAKMKKKR